MAETTLGSLPSKGIFPAAVANMSSDMYDALAAVVTAQNANNVSMRAAIDATVPTYSTVAINNTATKGLFSAPTTLLAAQGAGTLIEIIQMIVEYKYSTAKLTAGGALQASYDTGVTIPATPTIAATFLTAPAADNVIKVAGVLAEALSATVLNKPVIFTCATQDFATGAGTLIVKFTYRVHSGL